jgi:hypothetical protein
MSSESFASSDESQDIRQELESLNAGFRILLFSGLLVTASLCAFVYRQVSIQGRQIAAQSLALRQMGEERAKIGEALAQLKAFGVRSPDYAPVLAKYGLKPEPLPATTNPPAASAPKKP